MSLQKEQWNSGASVSAFEGSGQTSYFLYTVACEDKQTEASRDKTWGHGGRRVPEDSRRRGVGLTVEILTNSLEPFGKCAKLIGLFGII